MTNEIFSQIKKNIWIDISSDKLQMTDKEAF